MHDVLTDFIGLLRDRGVRISTSESIDAAQTLMLIGYADREILRTALAASLAKTQPEEEIFKTCFDAYFSFLPFSGAAISDDAIRKTANKADLSPLSMMLLESERAALMDALAAAGSAAAINGIAWQTQKGIFRGEILKNMGIDALDADIAALHKGGQGALSMALAEQREQLTEQVGRFVDAHYELYGRARQESVTERQLLHQNLATVNEQEFERMNAIVNKIVKRMKDVHSRRKRRYRKGILDVKRTLRENLKYGAVPFQLRWKRKKIERPDVVVLCDISRSMRQVVRFFLMLLYSLNREIVNIRSFAFCSTLAEVSHLFDRYGVAEGIARIETGHDCNILMSHTDYGQALRDFAALYGSCLSDRTTVIILGDGRNNFSNPETGILKMISARAKRIVWLNPEGPSFWGTGDSAMKQYIPFCHGVRECNTLKHLERAVDSLLA